MTDLILDHSDRMRSHPKEYGFSEIELAALTEEELMKGVTKERMMALGDWLHERAIADLRRAAQGRDGDIHLF